MCEYSTLIDGQWYDVDAFDGWSGRLGVPVPSKGACATYEKRNNWAKVGVRVGSSASPEARFVLIPRESTQPKRAQSRRASKQPEPAEGLARWLPRKRLALLRSTAGSLFAGADSGGERAASIYRLIGTAKPNRADPRVHLLSVLRLVGKHKSAALTTFAYQVCLSWWCPSAPLRCRPE